jgi:hypothetical protein
MGFDLTIVLNLRIDSKTGLPFVYAYNHPTLANFSMIPYVPSEYEVPENHRPYLQQRGHHFHFYIVSFAERTSIDVEEFLNEYPKWQDVVASMGDIEYGWTEKDHDGFKSALLWLSSKQVFQVEWSY